MDMNEVATLLHVTSEIAVNHPNMGGILRSCQLRLAEINTECVQAEVDAANEAAEAKAMEASKNYTPPTDGSEVPIEEPVEDPATIERRV